LPILRIPPDKDLGNRTKAKSDIDKDTEIEEINLERFKKRLLTKPSSISTKQAANNLKSVIKGKYISNINSAVTFCSNIEEGWSVNLRNQEIPNVKRKNASIKKDDTKLQSPAKKNTQSSYLQSISSHCYMLHHQNQILQVKIVYQK
jgi:hypothetical protein